MIKYKYWSRQKWFSCVGHTEGLDEPGVIFSYARYVRMLSAALIDNTIISYMMPIVYYMLNYGAGRKLGNYYLFSMRVLEYQPKVWLFTTGILLIFLSLLIKRLKPIWNW